MQKNTFFLGRSFFFGIPKTTTSWRLTSGHGGGIAKERFRRVFEGSLVDEPTSFGPPISVANVGRGNGTPAISGKSRLVKYYSIWPAYFGNTFFVKKTMGKMV